MGEERGGRSYLVGQLPQATHILVLCYKEEKERCRKRGKEEEERGGGGGREVISWDSRPVARWAYTFKF